MLNVSTYVDAILEDDRSPRFVLDLYEQSSLTKWTRVGKKLDDVIKVGGVMALAATQILNVKQVLSGMAAEEARYKPYMLKYDTGKDVFSTTDDDSKEKLKTWSHEFQAARKEQKSNYEWLIKTFYAQAGTSVLGMLNIFQSIGRAVDKRRFRTAIQDGMHSLMMSSHPEHRPALARIVNRIMAKDPFSDISGFGRKLNELLSVLMSFRDPRYEIHIESIRRFLM